MSLLYSRSSSYPRNATIHEFFEQVARRHPDDIALIFGEIQCTYSELNRRADLLANQLRTAGVGNESVVALCVTRSIEAIVGILAILKAGGGYLPLDPSWPAARLQFVLADSGAIAMVAKQEYAGIFPGVFAGPVFYFDAPSALPPAPIVPSPSSEIEKPGLAYIMYTSGSTGRPKGIAVTHSNVLRLVLNADYVSLSPDEVILQVAPLPFDASTFEIWAALLNGGRLIICPPGPISPEESGVLIARHGVTMAWFTAGLFHRIALEHLEILHPLRQLLAGGDVLSPKLVRKVLSEIDSITVINGYGPTENSVFTACHSMTRANPPEDTVLIGRPIANTSVYILDEKLAPVALGEVGELCTGGDGVARGYLNLPELTSERFVPDPFSDIQGSRMYRTGDLARQLPDGTLEFLGRLDRQVKVRGFRIELDEIEIDLSQHEEVGQAVVTVHDFGPEDRRIIAYYSSRSDDVSLEGRLRAFLAAQLPSFMLPHHYIRLDIFPLTPNGKVDRKALPDPAEIMARQASADILPMSETEQQIADLMAEVLQVGKVGPYDNFFALGGHSLTAFMLLARLRSRFGVRIDVRDFFSAPSLRELAEAVEQIGGSGREQQPELTIVQSNSASGDLPQSFSQQGMWLLDRISNATVAYILVFSFRLHGKISAAHFQKALNKIIERHEALRATFHIDNGNPVQLIHPECSADLELINLRDKDGREDELVAFVQSETKKGFDLACLPLLRTYLINMADDEYVFLFQVHHIIFDGWSLGVFLKELKICYEAYQVGREPTLPPLPFQYSDFTHWQISQSTEISMEQHLGFWRQALAGVPPILDLPTDHSRPSVQTYNGALLQCEIGSSLKQELIALALSRQASLFMILVAALAILLSRYSGRKDLLLGCAVSGRGRTEFEGLIGFFAKILPIRFRFPDNQRFSEFIGQVRETLLSALEHQDTSFEEIVKAVNPPRYANRPPLVQVLFTYLDISDQVGEIGGTELRQFHIDAGIARADLTFLVFNRKGNLEIGAEYNTDLFEKSTIKRLLDNLQTLLAGVVAFPEKYVDELPILNIEEERQLSIDWNSTAVVYPEMPGFHALIERQAIRTPERIAVSAIDGEITYGELDTRANRLACYLVDLGVKPGQFVGIFLARSTELLVALLGVLKAGAAYLPLDPDFPAERLVYMVSHSEAPLVLAERSLATTMPEFNTGILFLDEQKSVIQGCAATAPAPIVTPNHPAYIIYTSGSTGQPKGVKVPHRAVTNFLLSMAGEPGLSAGDVLLAVTTLSFDMSVLELFLPLTVGARVVVASRETAMDGQRLRADMERQGVTIFQATPTTFRLLQAAGWNGGKRLRVICGGEAIPRDLADYLFDKTGEAWNGYGPTETTVYSTCWKITKRNGPALIGKPIANTEVYVLDANMRPVPIGVAGELYIGGMGVTDGYLNNPELTAQQFVENPFSLHKDAKLYKTGDLVRFQADGNLEYLNRLDNQVKLRGFRIELGEIESVLNTHPDIAQAVAVVRDVQPGDARLIVYLVSRDGRQTDTAALRAHLKERLPVYMIPQHFVSLRSLPLTATNKIDRKALPEPDLGKTITEAEYISPQTETEKQLAEIWQDVLQLERVSVESNFFELGGHSLLAVKLVARIQKWTGIDLPFVIFFNAPTIRALAKVLEGNTGEESSDGRQANTPLAHQWRPLVALQSTGSRPPFFLVHAVGGNLLNFHALLYSLGSDQPVYGLQARGLDGVLPPFSSIEEMARCYIAEIRTVQATGPYFLGGACFGGLVAFEIAQQLARQGEKIAFLCMFDMVGPGKDGYRHLFSLETGLIAALTNAAKSETSIGRYFLNRIYRSIRSRAVNLTRHIRYGFSRLRRHPNPLDLREWLITRTHLQAIEKYVPALCYSPITLFRSLEQNSSSSSNDDPGSGWEEVARGGLKVINISAPHNAFVEAPELWSHLAKELKAAQESKQYEELV